MNRVADLRAGRPEAQTRALCPTIPTAHGARHRRTGTARSTATARPRQGGRGAGLPGALEAVARLNQAGWHGAGQQPPGIGRGLLDMVRSTPSTWCLNQLLRSVEAGSTRCSAPHARGCSCRKPPPGLIEQIGERFGVQLSEVHGGRLCATFRPPCRRLCAPTCCAATGWAALSLGRSGIRWPRCPAPSA